MKQYQNVSDRCNIYGILYLMEENLQENEDWRTKERGDDAAREWALERSEAFGNAVSRFRRSLELSAVQLANRTKEIGYPITRSTIARIEGNHRKGKIDICEVLTLAAALEVAPSDLLFGGDPLQPIRAIPRIHMTNKEAKQWLLPTDEYDQWADLHRPRLSQTERLAKAIDDYQRALAAFITKHLPEKGTARWFLNSKDMWKSEEKARDFNDWEIRALKAEYEQIAQLRERAIKFGGEFELPEWFGCTTRFPF